MTDYEQMKPIAAASLSQAKSSGGNRVLACFAQDPLIERQFTAADF